MTLFLSILIYEEVEEVVEALHHVLDGRNDEPDGGADNHHLAGDILFSVSYILCGQILRKTSGRKI